MSNGYKIAASIGGLVAAIMLLATIAYSVHLISSSAAFAYPSTGQTVAIHNKTRVSFVTQEQLNFLYDLVILNGGLSVVSMILYLIGRRSV